MSYWYCEYERKENGVINKFTAISKSNNVFPELVDMIPDVGSSNISISQMFEISKETYEKIYAKMSSFESRSINESWRCIEQFGSHGFELSPFTRDTFGIAVKATYAEDENCNPIMIFKNPKTDTGHFKKSQKGCCFVQYDENGSLYYEDGHTFNFV